MAHPDSNGELWKLARNLTLSSKVYSDTLANIAKQTTSIDAISGAVC